MMWKNIQPFVLKSDKYTNDQTNDNGPNAKLKSIYNVEKSTWMMKYGTKKFSPRHMHSILFEAWDTFNISSGNIIGDRFSKTELPPLSPTDLTTNTQECDASIQVYSGAKAEEINNTGYQEWWSYGFTLIKGYAKIIKEHYSPSCSIWRCDKNNSHPY